jgi:hypothetical protein
MEPTAKPKRIERPGKLCTGGASLDRPPCGTPTIVIRLEDSTWPTFVFCPKCDRLEAARD